MWHFRTPATMTLCYVNGESLKSVITHLRHIANNASPKDFMTHLRYSTVWFTVTQRIFKLREYTCHCNKSLSDAKQKLDPGKSPLSLWRISRIRNDASPEHHRWAKNHWRIFGIILYHKWYCHSSPNSGSIQMTHLPNTLSLIESMTHLHLIFLTHLRIDASPLLTHLRLDTYP